MDFIDAIILGVVQGLTEFLPVSSSGHLVMAETLLGTEPEGGIVFEVALHVATMIAIMAFYHKRIWNLILGALKFERATWQYIGKLAVGTSPAIVVALLVRDFIEAQFDAPVIVGLMLLLTGAIVFSTRYTVTRGDAIEPSWRDAFLIGCAQAFAILPGITRSGTTVAAAMALGMAPLAAAEFSFMLGVIAMAGAAVLMAPELAHASASFIQAILVGGAVALVSGLLALFSFVWLLRTKRFHIFAWYAWFAGGSFLAYLLLR